MPGDALEVAERPSQELVERCERQLRLGLDAAGGENVHALGPLAGVVEEGRLSDPGLAAQHERAATRGAGSVEQRPDDSLLGGTATQHVAMVTTHFLPTQMARIRRFRRCERERRAPMWTLARSPGGAHVLGRGRSQRVCADGEEGTMTFVHRQPVLLATPPARRAATVGRRAGELR